MYLDDKIVATSGLEAVTYVSDTVQTTLQQADFVVNIEKSQWDPIQILIWLGFVLNLSQGMVLVPDHKIKALRNNLTLYWTRTLPQLSKLQVLWVKLFSCLLQ